MMHGQTKIKFSCFYERESVPEAAQGGFEEKLGCWPSCGPDERNVNITKNSGVKKVSVVHNWYPLSNRKEKLITSVARLGE